VTDAVDALATDYQELRLRTFPTWAHMIGDYGYVDHFEEVGLEAEDRQIAQAREFAARAEAIPEDGLSADDRISREMVAWDATARADFSGARLDEFGADPIFGVQASLPVRIPKLTIPDADIAEGFIGKYHGIATYFRDLAGRHREGVAHGRTPADFAVRQTVEQIDRWLATPLAEDPLLNTAHPGAMDGADLEAWKGRLPGSSTATSGRRPRRTATRSATTSSRMPAPTTSPGCAGWPAATRPMRRRSATTRLSG
jgi:uncharacterized protein (DUF885 family)